MRSSVKKHPGGRPPKFNEPRRPVTMTLPDRTLRRMASIDPDRARAVTKLVDAATGANAGGERCVELVKVAPGKAVIFVARSAHLGRIPWVRLVEVAPGRHLVSVAPGTPVEKLEVAIGDLLETVPADESDERELLSVLLQNIRAPRRNHRITKEEILFVESVEDAAGATRGHS